MGEPEKNVQQSDGAPNEADARGAGDQHVDSERHPPGADEPIWARIKRHKVVEWTLAYAAFGYALLHGVQMLRETFEWPLLVPRLTVFGLVLGTPVAATLAWYHGHRARHRISGPELSILIALLLVAGSVLWWVTRQNQERAIAPTTIANTATSPAPPAAVFNPPPHSIAVLPFVNMSGDKEQEWFSDGLSEELLNDLSRINELSVAARTSAFSFKGKDTEISTIARKLNVGAVLEGSVRRSSHKIRVTAQLINAVTGFHVWSQTYDRDLGDVLKLQTEIAEAVTGALKVTLLEDFATKVKIGGTRSPAAYDAYLRSAAAYWRGDSDAQSMIAGYKEAIRLDPDFALAYAELSIALNGYAQSLQGPAVDDVHRQAVAAARKAVALAPDLADSHLALGIVQSADFLDFESAYEEFERAMALAPGNVRVLRDFGPWAVEMGHTDAGIAAARRAAALDPLNVNSYTKLAGALLFARRYDEALAAYRDGLSLRPNDANLASDGWGVYYALGDFEKARALCEGVGEAVKEDVQDCLALAYHRLGRQADAETALARFRALMGNAGAYGYAQIYAQWGNTPQALGWLETALRLRNSDLEYLKTDPLLDPLRNEPRFQAIERALRFPD